MIGGRFDARGRPVLSAEVVLPGGIVQVVPFLVDTGAESTILMPGDSIRLRVDFKALSTSVPVKIGGEELHGHPQEIALRFAAGGHVYTFFGDVLIVDPGLFPTIRHPSILGRGFWSRLKLTIDYTNGTMTADPVRPDEKDPP